MNGTGTAGLQLPQLPQLDKRDIEAVRNFLPGKVLGRTAALLSLVLLVLGFAGAVDWMLEQHLGVNLRSVPWLRAVLLGGLPLLVVTTQVALEWQAERQCQRMRALAVEPGRVPVGYFRIGPYGGADRERFDRADEVQWKVLNWIRYTVSVPLYLIGDSGCGKSSLLNACVLALTIDGTGLAMAWQWVSLYEVRSDLAELGLTVTIESGNAEIEANSHLSPTRFDASGPLLARLNASTRITSVQLNAVMIVSLEPLKSLSALSRLELAGTKVDSLEPLQDLPHVHIVGGGTSARPESVPAAERIRFAAYRAGRSLPAAW
jgi:hypothetical protein